MRALHRCRLLATKAHRRARRLHAWVALRAHAAQVAAVSAIQRSVRSAKFRRTIAFAVAFTTAAKEAKRATQEELIR